MTVQEKEHSLTATSLEKTGFFAKTRIRIVAITAAVILLLAMIIFFSYNAVIQKQQEKARLYQEEQEEQVRIENERYEQALAVVRTDKFYPGIYVNDVDLSELTLEEARTLLLSAEQERLALLEYKFIFEDDEWIFAKKELKAESNIEEIIKEAWHTGRLSGLQGEREQIYDRLQQIEDLQASALLLQSSISIDHAKLERELKTIAVSLEIEPQNAEISGFDLASKTFIVSELVDGRQVSFEEALEKMQTDFADGRLTGSYQLASSPISAEGAELKASLAHLGLVSEAKTLATATDGPRDNNIYIAVQTLNGHVVLPGEIFSFNEVVGQRTAAKGYQAAGVIQDGNLVTGVGGGICQPNTTLYQAALKADLKIVERHPHTFPSSYTAVGIDAAIDWGWADLKFTNNTEFPLAIVCWYNKPEIVFQIYGRSLGDGVQISLSSEVVSQSPPEEPIQEEVDTLEPGEIVLIRAPHDMISARAYKVWTINGEYWKSEEIASSYYPPIRALYEVGPEEPEEAGEGEEGEEGEEEGAEPEPPEEEIPEPEE